MWKLCRTVFDVINNKKFLQILAVVVWLTFIFLYFNNITSDKDEINMGGHSTSHNSEWVSYIDLFLRTPFVGPVKIDPSLRTQMDMSGIYRVPKNVVWVNGHGSLHDRILQYNEVISELRNATSKYVGLYEKTLQQNVRGHDTVNIFGNSQDYISSLTSIPGVVTILLSWLDTDGISKDDGKWSSLLDDSNVLINKYYRWVGAEQLCVHLKNGSFTRHRWDTVFNHQCSSNISLSFQEKSIDQFFLNSVQINQNYYWPNKGTAWPSYFYTDVPRYITYIHIIQNGIVNQLGEVYTGKYRIVPYNCKPNFEKHSKTPDASSIPLYDEVFSISQYWGNAFFHKNLEEFPKLGPYIEFLKQHLEIKIHTYEKGEYTSAILTLLGLDPSRLISGTIRAHQIYLPRGTSCGFSQIQEAQLLSDHIRQTIKERATGSSKNLVLVRRSQKRFFTEHKDLAHNLKLLAEEFGLQFYLFRDDPLPTLEETMREFGKAAMVVAPHGAGLSNLIFTEPGTIVLEGLCEPPHTNMCYTRLSHLLGHRYYGFLSRGGCEGHITVPAREIEMVARNYLLEVNRTKTDPTNNT